MKKTLKRTISAVLACVLLLALLPASALAASWESHWSAGYIRTALDNGWIETEADGSVPAGEKLTRAEAAVILWKALGSPDAQTGCPFTDVADADKPAVAALAEKGVINGTGGKTFNPDGALTRQEGIVLLARAFELKADDANAAAGFADWANVAGWARDAVAAAVEKGIVNGVGGNRLAPAQDITLGEVVKLIVVANEKAAVDEPIEKVSTIAFVDVDGPKVKAIVVEYGTELLAGSVDLDTYDVFTYANLPQVFDVKEGNDGSSGGGPGAGGSDAGGPEQSQGPDAAQDSGEAKEEAEGNQFYETLPAFEIQNGEPGAPTKVYVSATPEIDPDGVGDASGKYVIIEVNTDYQLAAVSSDWRACVAGGVQQLKDIVSGDSTIAPTGNVVGNYEPGYFWDINPMGSNHSVTLQKVFDDSLYVLEGLEGYQLYTDNTTGRQTVHHDAISAADRTLDYDIPDATVLSKVAGGSFKATDCFSEADGEYHDVSLMYSLFVPEDYEAQVAAGKKFALALHIEDAGALGDDPMIALTEAQAAANYASDRVQQLAKDQGLGGLIVVLPQVPKAGQTMADNLTGNEYVPATWQLMDYLTDTYEIDMNRIYGSGQSMGGMQVLDMAAQRDNYFAAIWSIGSQWGNNYNKEEPYGMGPNAHGYYSYPVDGTIITNPDWENWYYSISDDNILVTNMTGDASATGYWNQVKELYSKFAGVSFPYVEWDPVATAKADQSAKLQALVAEPNELGIYWNALSNGSHKATWIYAHAISTSYDWLLQQTKETEDARGKLEELKGSYAEDAGTYLYNSLTQSAATVTAP